MSRIIKEKYYIAPGTGGKMYVLRHSGVRGYFSGNYPFDRLVQVDRKSTRLNSSH